MTEENNLAIEQERDDLSLPEATEEPAASEAPAEEGEPGGSEPEESAEACHDAGEQTDAADPGAQDETDAEDPVAREEASASDAPEETEEEVTEAEEAGDTQPVQKAADAQTPDPAALAAKRLFIVRIAAVALGVLGVLMLICGIVLRRLDEESRRTPEKAQMPEEYIEEFFSEDNFVPHIEDFIEPEA